MAVSDQPDISKLARKLAERFHLNVMERALLPEGKMPWSTFANAVDAIIAECGRYPSQWADDTPYSGIVLESVPGGYSLRPTVPGLVSNPCDHQPG